MKIYTPYLKKIKRIVYLSIALIIKMIYVYSQAEDPGKDIKYFVQNDLKAKKIFITVDLTKIMRNVCIDNVVCTLNYVNTNNQIIGSQSINFGTTARNGLAYGDVYKQSLPLNFNNAYKAKGGIMAYKYFSCEKADEFGIPGQTNPANDLPEEITEASNPNTAKVVGEWEFIFNSTVSGGTHTGKLVLQSDEISGVYNVIGTLTDDTTNNSISGAVYGTFVNDKLTLYRKTGVDNILQYYQLNYSSKTKMSGTFLNKTHGYNKNSDQGTFELRRRMITRQLERIGTE